MAAGLYDITNQTLGKGHFAVVKLAKHCLTGESVAIKIIDKAKLNKEGLQQLSIEIRLWSRLSEHEHPNVVKLYQVIDTRTKLYLVMEYCGRDVCDLYDHIQKRNHGNGLKESEAKHIFRQICDAISYCHSLKIVHRDLKPENILMIAQPTEQLNSRLKYPLVKLIDFGFSNQWAEGEMLRTSCGSLAYSAPEILLGDHYDGPKVDIWGLGCILYILLYGNNPFMQINDSETLCRILDCTFSTPPRPSISESAIELIKALLKREPDTRLTIQQIIAHKWLNDVEELCFESLENTSKLQFVPKNVKKSVHDRVIDQMITKGIATSREYIENALEKGLLQENTSSTTKTMSEEIPLNGERTQSSLNHEHYVKATYHLLKDKSMRELHGLNQNNSSVNQSANQNVSGHLPKRLLPLKPRKHLIQQISRITKPFQEEDGEEDNPISFTANVRNVQQLELPADDGNGFVLPLARKCSIVSEEGSCVAEGTGSDISSCDGPTFTNEDQNVTHSIVNIVVTDCSEVDETEDIQNSNESVNVELGPISGTNESCIEPEIKTNNKNGHIITNKKPSNMATNPTLHLVSSSPELLRSNEMEEESDYENYVSQPSRSRPKTMILYNERKHDKDNDHIITHFGTNVSTNNTNSPSMRIIVQSKSCSNISYNENDSSNTDNKNCELKNATSVCMKRHKSDRTDCCIIC